MSLPPSTPPLVEDDSAVPKPLSLVTATHQPSPALQRSVSGNSVGAWGESSDEGDRHGDSFSGNVSDIDDDLDDAPSSVGLPEGDDPDRLAEAQSQLVAMGYDAADAMSALQRANGDIARAVEVLCGGILDEDEDAANGETFGEPAANTSANVTDWMADAQLD